MGFAAAVLAAGRSARMGRPKALLDAGDGRTFLSAACGALRVAGADPVLVIVAAGAEDVELAVPADCVAVPNAEPELGQVHSTALALEAALELGHTWAMIALVDHPAVRVATVETLAARAREEPGAVHVPTWRGARGHPAALPTALAPALHEAREGEGARDVIARLGVVVREHPMDDPGVLVDVDTKADLERWRSGKTP